MPDFVLGDSDEDRATYYDRFDAQNPLIEPTAELPPAANQNLPMTPPQVVTRPPSGLMGEEEKAQKEREGETPPQE